jgi:hypothetical protein
MIAFVSNRQIALLLAGLLAAAPACAATTDDVESVEASADELKVAAVYSSKEYTIKTFEFDAVTNKSVEKFVKAKVRVTVAKAGKKGKDYEYDGRGVMANEFKIQFIDANGKSVNWEGDTYYAKATSKKGEFRLFYCQSTNNCSGDAAQATVTVSADEKSMTISGLGIKADGYGTNRIFLDDAIGRSITLTK